MVCLEINCSDASCFEIVCVNDHDVLEVGGVEISHRECSCMELAYECFAGDVWEVSQLSKYHVLGFGAFVAMP